MTPSDTPPNAGPPRKNRRGSAPGERRGGRAKGVPNKATRERALLAEREVQAATAERRPIAKDVLDNLMGVFMKLASHYLPGKDEAPPQGARAARAWLARLRQFERWSLHAADMATKLAPYQSPTLRALLVQQAPEAPAQLALPPPGEEARPMTAKEAADAYFATLH